jgi:uncharacterized protein
MLTIGVVIVYIILGLVAGLLAGLLGIGGGAIVVPSLLVTFTHIGFHPDTVMHSAVGTSLAAMIFTAGSSAWSHYKQTGIYWDYFKWMAPGIILGALLGAVVAEMLSSHDLKLVFGILLIFTGIYFLSTSNQEELEVRCHPRPQVMVGVGLVIGFISSLLGIGGGVITVPLLILLGASIKQAISTSAVSGFLIALFGALSFVVIGLLQTNARESTGDVNIPAFLIIGIIAFFAAPVGARYAHSAPVHLLKLIFGVIQIAIGVSIFYF